MLEGRSEFISHFPFPLSHFQLLPSHIKKGWDPITGVRVSAPAIFEFTGTVSKKQAEATSIHAITRPQARSTSEEKFAR